jgi:hypothetical protein
MICSCTTKAVAVEVSIPIPQEKVIELENLQNTLEEVVVKEEVVAKEEVSPSDSLESSSAQDKPTKSTSISSLFYSLYKSSLKTEKNLELEKESVNETDVSPNKEELKILYAQEKGDISANDKKLFV